MRRPLNRSIQRARRSLLNQKDFARRFRPLLDQSRDQHTAPLTLNRDPSGGTGFPFSDKSHYPDYPLRAPFPAQCTTSTVLGVSPTDLLLKIDSNDRSNLDTEKCTEHSQPNTGERDSTQPPLDPAMELYIRNVLRECRQLEDSQDNGHLTVPSRTFYTLDDLKRLADSREQLRMSETSNGSILLFSKKHRHVSLRGRADIGCRPHL